MLTIETRRQGLVEVTHDIASWVRERAMQQGLLTIFCRHTSASLLIQENADPDVRRDLEDFFARLAPPSAGYRHQDEGPDDMPAHIKSSLTGTGLLLPVARGRLALGTWQGVYLCEHRDDGGARTLLVTLFGE